jgi:hypothetical protein
MPRGWRSLGQQASALLHTCKRAPVGPVVVFVRSMSDDALMTCPASASTDIVTASGLTALVSLGLVASRLIFRYQVTRVYGQHRYRARRDLKLRLRRSVMPHVCAATCRAAQLATTQNYSRGEATLSTLLLECSRRDVDETVLAFSALCAAGHSFCDSGSQSVCVSSASFNESCDRLLRMVELECGEGSIPLRLSGARGLETLIRMGIATRTSDGFITVLSLPDAACRVSEVLQCQLAEP